MLTCEKSICTQAIQLKCVESVNRFFSFENVVLDPLEVSEIAVQAATETTEISTPLRNITYG